MPDVRGSGVKARRDARLEARVRLGAGRYHGTLFEAHCGRAALRAAIENRIAHAFEVRTALVLAARRL